MSELSDSKQIRKEKQKSFSTLAIVFLLIIISISISFHINNVLTVNDLVVKNDDLNKKLDKIIASNNVLRTEIESLTSLQKILPKAKELGLEYNKDEVKFLDSEK